MCRIHHILATLICFCLRSLIDVIQASKCRVVATKTSGWGNRQQRMCQISCSVSLYSCYVRRFELQIIRQWFYVIRSARVNSQLTVTSCFLCGPDGDTWVYSGRMPAANFSVTSNNEASVLSRYNFESSCFKTGVASETTNSRLLIWQHGRATYMIDTIMTITSIYVNAKR